MKILESSIEFLVHSFLQVNCFLSLKYTFFFSDIIRGLHIKYSNQFPFLLDGNVYNTNINTISYIYMYLILCKNITITQFLAFEGN